MNFIRAHTHADEATVQTSMYIMLWTWLGCSLAPRSFICIVESWPKLWGIFYICCVLNGTKQPYSFLCAETTTRLQTIRDISRLFNVAHTKRRRFTPLGRVCIVSGGNIGAMTPSAENRTCCCASYCVQCITSLHRYWSMGVLEVSHCGLRSWRS